MSVIQPYLHAGFRCDQSGCGVTLDLPEVSFYGGETEGRDEEMFAAGWEVRMGRSKRHYCPEHAQRPGETWYPGDEKRARSNAYWANRGAASK